MIGSLSAKSLSIGGVPLLDPKNATWSAWAWAVCCRSRWPAG